MTHSEFEALLTEQFALEKEILTSRSNVYSANNDRLHNFYRLSMITGLTPQQVCLVLMGKHFVALTDYVLTGNSQPPFLLDEWVTDIRNYLILMKALYKDSKEALHEDTIK